MNPIGVIVVAITTLFPAYQLINLANVQDQLALFSQYLGLAALILMSWGQIWATRLPGVETIFGGLDRVYILHKWAGIISMVFILLHDTIDADMRNLGPETILNDVAETLGEISLYGLLVLVVISIATFIPYHLWKWTHKAMGFLFTAGALHFFFIMKPFNMSDPAGLYTGLFCLAGILSYVWTLLPETWRPSRAYKIIKLEETGGAIAVTMKPETSSMKPYPGQFAIVNFHASGNTEPHPFSFSKIYSDGAVRITIKSLGDYTSGLGRSLKVGQEVSLQGPFGRFKQSNTKPQIWIAGGIGITPFVTWADALSTDAPPVHLFYCIRSTDEAPHIKEIEQLAKKKPNLNLHLFISNNDNRITADKIHDLVGVDLNSAKVSFCGPAKLRNVLQKELRKFGVGPRDFHYEAFEFRTGIGLGRLAQWLLLQSASKISSQPGE